MEERKKRRLAGVPYVQPPILQGPEAWEYCQFTIRKGDALDAMQSLGVINISVSKVPGGQRTVSPLCSPFTEQTLP